MKSLHRLFGAAVATVLIAGLVSGRAAAAPVFPEGTAITGSPASLLGFNAGLNDYFAGGVSAINDANIEFLTDDFALFIDFQSNGVVSLFDNLGSGADVFNNTLQFSFAGLPFALTGIQPLDLSALTAGKFIFSVINANTLSLSLSDVQFSPEFTHLDLKVSVPEPPMLALFALGIFGVYFARRRSPLVRGTEVAP